MTRKITTYTLKKSTEHLFYEAEMFCITLALLTQVNDQMNKNILLDGFVIHTRNLFDFLYPKRNIHKDDMVATDFLTHPKTFNISKTKKKDLMFIVGKANKQVAHLTYSRNRYSGRTKQWSYVFIGRKMLKTLCAFYNCLSTQYKGWPNIINLKKVIDTYANL
jgi:hypothetical protein